VPIDVQLLAHDGRGAEPGAIAREVVNLGNERLDATARPRELPLERLELKGLGDDLVSLHWDLRRSDAFPSVSSKTRFILRSSSCALFTELRSSFSMSPGVSVDFCGGLG
jgi:hypothetical protein